MTVDVHGVVHCLAIAALSGTIVLSEVWSRKMTITKRLPVPDIQARPAVLFKVTLHEWDHPLSSRRFSGSDHT